MLNEPDVAVHPALEEASAGLADIAVGIEQPLLELQEDLRLGESMLRRCCCAIEVPGAPGEMPTTPAGLPALWP